MEYWVESYMVIYFFYLADSIRVVHFFAAIHSHVYQDILHVNPCVCWSIHLRNGNNCSWNGNNWKTYFHSVSINCCYYNGLNNCGNYYRYRMTGFTAPKSTTYGAQSIFQILISSWVNYLSKIYHAIRICGK